MSYSPRDTPLDSDSNELMLNRHNTEIEQIQKQITSLESTVTDLQDRFKIMCELLATMCSFAESDKRNVYKEYESTIIKH